MGGGPLCMLRTDLYTLQSTALWVVCGGCVLAELLGVTNQSRLQLILSSCAVLERGFVWILCVDGHCVWIFPLESRDEFC